MASGPTATPASAASALAAPMMRKKAPRNEKDTPCTIGRRDPIVVCNSVATPEQSMTAEINRAISAGLIPIAGPNNRGTLTVAPNIVNTCCSPRTTVREAPGRSSRP